MPIIGITFNIDLFYLAILMPIAHGQGRRYHMFQVFGGTGPPILEGRQI